MREQLFACEPTALIASLEQLENASAAEIRLASSMFTEDKDEEDPVDDIYDEDTEGTARIRVEGMLTQNGPSPLARLFGITGTSYKAIAGACDRAMASACKSVTLAINSPGGEAAGVDACWQKVAALSAKKPCMAENHGLMASAAYWLATACPSIKAMSPACEQGSIGVKIVAIDDSKAGEAMGYKRVTIVSKNAPNKNDDISTKGGREALQARADAMEDVFTMRVAEGRGTTVDDVRANFGQGAVMIASEARRVGMIDDVQMRADAGTPAVPDNFSRKPAAGVLAASADESTRRKPMTLKELIASDAMAKAELDGMLATAKAEGHAAGKLEMQAVAKKVGVYLTSDVYSKSKPIVERALKAIAGEASVETVEAAVSMFDLMAEDKKQQQAAAEQEGQQETPGQVQPAGADLLAKAAALKIDVADLNTRALAAKMDPVKALEAEIANQELLARDRANRGA